MSLLIPLLPIKDYYFYFIISLYFREGLHSVFGLVCDVELKSLESYGVIFVLGSDLGVVCLLLLVHHTMRLNNTWHAISCDNA